MNWGPQHTLIHIVAHNQTYAINVDPRGLCLGAHIPCRGMPYVISKIPSDLRGMFHDTHFPLL